MKNVGSPWLSRSFVSGSARQIARTCSKGSFFFGTADSLPLLPVALVVRPRLRPVTAGLHGAPAAGAVLRAVVVEDEAVVGRAELDALPFAPRAGGRDVGDDLREHAADA